ncbi:MAG: hypothetical protein RL417_424 [Pseudomonadota bacterium]|jgi:hypothetical protein
MDPTHRPNNQPNPEDLHRLMAEDFGLEGRKFLVQNEDAETLQALGRILTAELQSKYVSPDGIKALHPAITDEMAKREALSMSQQLLWHEIKEMLDDSRPISMSDMAQVFAGTSMATREALVTVCLALGLRASAVLEEARDRRWESGPME